MPNGENKVVVSGGGVGLGGLLFVVFLVLKLTGHITWSWWWVAAPLWIPFGIAISIMLLAVVVYGVIKMLQVLVD